MLILLVVIVTSIWVHFDARSIGARKGLVPGFFDIGPGMWLFACLLLWIVSFPAYLIKRGAIKRAAAAATPAAAPSASPSAPETDLDQLGKLGDLRAEGVLTEEEFAAKKRAMLGSQ